MAAEKPLDPQHVAEAFSRHRFADVYDRLSRDVQWVIPGHETVAGKDAVVAACDAALEEMSQLAGTEFSRFVSVGDDRVAAVDAVGRYLSQDGSVSVVSSADIYEFDTDGSIITITSYAVEVDVEG